MTPRLHALALASLAGLQGCSTPNHATALHEEERVRRVAEAPSQLPTLPRGACIKRALASRGADASKLHIAVDDMENVTLLPGPGSGHSPQLRFNYPVQHALVDLGFTVPWSMKMAAEKPARGRYMMSGGLTAYIPLSFSFVVDENYDFTLIGAEREKVIAAGKTRATATLYAGTDEEYLSFASAESDMVFFQVKGKDTLTIANKNGWINGGTARERMEVLSSQEAALLSILDAMYGALSKGLGLNC